MPFVLILAGAMIAISALQDTHKELWEKFSGDFTGEGNFIYWFASIGAIGAIGYAGKEGGATRTFSNYFMALIIVVMILANNRSGKNFFKLLVDEIKEGTTEVAAPLGAPLITSANSGAAGGGFGDIIGSISPF